MQKYSKTGGILTIIAGTFSIFYLVMGIMYMLLPQLMDSALISKPSTMKDANQFMIFITIFGVVICLFAVIAGTLSIVGGVFGLKKKHWAIALAGAISSALLFFPIGIIATVLISMGRSEFSGSQTSDSPTEMGQNTVTDTMKVIE